MRRDFKMNCWKSCGATSSFLILKKGTWYLSTWEMKKSTIDMVNLSFKKSRNNKPHFFSSKNKKIFFSREPFYIKKSIVLHRMGYRFTSKKGYRFTSKKAYRFTSKKGTVLHQKRVPFYIKKGVPFYVKKKVPFYIRKRVPFNILKGTDVAHLLASLPSHVPPEECRERRFLHPRNVESFHAQDLEEPRSWGRLKDGKVRNRSKDWKVRNRLKDEKVRNRSKDGKVRNRSRDGKVRNRSKDGKVSKRNENEAKGKNRK